MSRAQPVLSSIPETDEEKPAKWVPKKKHEVLKAKYKCLKKLFQIYDASIVGMMPQEGYEQQNGYENHSGFETHLEIPEEPKRVRKKKRYQRSRTDSYLCALSVTESNHGDVSDMQSETFCSISRDYISEKRSCLTSQIQSDCRSINASTQDSRATINCKSVLVLQKECNHTQTVQQTEPAAQQMEATVQQIPQMQHPIPYLMFNEKPPIFNPPPVYTEKRRITRFQFFLQRILGIRCERPSKPFVLPNGHVLASSENNIIHERRKRRGLRFCRFRRPKVIKSDGALRDMNDPVILNYVQCVQRSCLLDTTPRQCPIVGCRMMFYGIINYNDHLNLCHFIERKYICHYCHEGFENEHDKFVHENEHIGITKLNVVPNVTQPVSSPGKSCTGNTCDAQREKDSEVQHAKLKKIVSFFDKIVDSDIVTEMRKCQSSETTIGKSKGGSDSKKTISCTNTCQSRLEKTCSERTDFTFAKMAAPSNTCKICGETFANRRQLSFHVDLEHRCTDKFSKFHSCAGIVNSKIQSNMSSADGKIQVDSRVASKAEIHRIPASQTLTQTDLRVRRSDDSMSCSSSNMVCYSSMEALPSMIQSKKPLNYRWEPNNNVIRV